MTGIQRVKEEALETAMLLGHHMQPFTIHGDKEIARCNRAACKATIIVQHGDTSGYALTHVCPFLEQTGPAEVP